MSHLLASWSLSFVDRKRDLLSPTQGGGAVKLRDMRTVSCWLWDLPLCLVTGTGEASRSPHASLPGGSL